MTSRGAVVEANTMAMFQQEETKASEKATEEAEQMVEGMPLSASDPVVAAAVGSVLYSWYHFYIKNDTDTALFVGLWAPTLLTAASYLHQKDIVRKFKQGLTNF